jgi:hypothetical protein
MLARAPLSFGNKSARVPPITFEMHRDDALALACGALCLQVHSTLPAAMQGVSIALGPVLDTDTVTWLAKDARFYTLVKTPRGTRVYDHADDLLYYAGPHAELAKACPDGHAFLCQTVCDRQATGPPVPRLLVLDMVSPAIECPRQRGEALRQLAHHLPHVCHIQWAGEKRALEAFLPSVPHDVEAVVALRAPLQLVRERPASGIAALHALELPR